MPGPVRDRYRPIADYGLIGDMESAALVASDGSIDWWCPPRFDAPSVFGAILDREKGGFFRIHGGDRAASSAAYLPRTNVLRTEFQTGTGAFALTDFLPAGVDARNTPVRLFRIVRGLAGESRVHVDFVPRFRYGALTPRLSSPRPGIVVAIGGGQTLALLTPTPLTLAQGAATGTLLLREGEEAAFGVAYLPYILAHPPEVAADANRSLESTVAYWHAWVAGHVYRGAWKEHVLRSALVLKLLTYDPTGAVVAAPTCSLPEWLGGVRNWDYRYAWVRDAVFAVRALAVVGHAEEATRFVDWIVRSADPDPAKLRVLYSVTGLPNPEERVLDHLEGYRRSRPVRVGNAAELQYQLDVYGELVEGAFEAGLLARVDPGGRTWAYFRSLADYVADHWRTKDQGIWEVRCPPQDFLLSKAMAWAALDRAATAAEAGGFPGDVARWRREADSIRADALERGWSGELGAFQQSYERPLLDAANLLLPILGFVEPDDPRMLATIDATIERLTVNGLVYRYLGADDGLPGSEATFVCCTFWLVEALAMAGRIEEAKTFFERALSRASPLGLFAEEVDAATGEHLGNFPQGFPHIGLIRAAQRLAEAERRLEKAAIARKAIP